MTLSDSGGRPSLHTFSFDSGLPGYAAWARFSGQSLREYAQRTDRNSGYAFADNVGFILWPDLVWPARTLPVVQTRS